MILPYLPSRVQKIYGNEAIETDEHFSMHNDFTDRSHDEKGNPGIVAGR